MSGSGAFEESTPAEAQTKPCRVSAITSGGRVRTIRADSRRITSSWRGSSSPASSRASVGGLDLGQTNDPSLGLRDRLLRDHEDVAVLQLGPLRDQRAEVVSLADLRQPLDRPDRDGHGRPVSRRPAWTPNSLFTFRITAVIALERARVRERADVDRAPPTSRPASSSASFFARRVVAADERVLVGRLRAREVDRGDRLQAGCNRRPQQLAPGSRPASLPRGRGRCRCR